LEIRINRERSIRGRCTTSSREDNQVIATRTQQQLNNPNSSECRGIDFVPEACE
jgi:hypothetical protein